MGAVRFLLNGATRTEADAPPTTTVLDWLRNVARLTGTKEGCAEGDCGACTILVAPPQDGSYHAVNSCLMALPQLDGCAVLTVEGVAPAGGLHPVQRALVETDGTQCGFCTPGFVMAMAAFAQTGEPATDANIHEALAGNLCRCTGYRSIVDACRRVAAAPPAVAPPSAIAASSEYRHGKQLFVAPRSLADLLAARARYPDAPLLAGGTDLGLRFSKGREALPVLISTARAAELQRIVEHADAIEIGGAVTYTAALPAIDRHFQSFGALVRRIGSRQIRNLGTFAGNLATASPIGDTLPCLIALEASVTLAGGNRTLPVEDFITGYRKTALAPDEVIAGIRIPLLPSGPHFAAYKLSKRFDQDISAVVAAFVLDVRDGCVRSLRAAFGGMADRAKRATTLEAALAGRPWTEASLADVDAMLARDFAPMSDQRAGGAYRLRAAAGLVRRLQVETTSAVPTRVEAL